MKCPSCGYPVNDNVTECPECGFSMTGLEKKITELPRKSGFLIDKAEVVEERFTNQIFEYLVRFNRKNGIEFYVVTVSDCGNATPEEYAFYFLNKYSIGGDSHRGIVLLLAEKERKLVCEVGYSLEGLLSDAEAKDFLERDIIPLLHEQGEGVALWAAVNLFCDQLVNGRVSSLVRFFRRIAGKEAVL